jgi:hypothetical protein
MDEKITKPTIETVLDRMNAVEQRMGERIDASEQRLGEKITALDLGVGERISACEQRLVERIVASDQLLGERMNIFEERFGTRLDRIEGLAYTCRGEILDLRADFRDLRKQLREHLPALPNSV